MLPNPKPIGRMGPSSVIFASPRSEECLNEPAAAFVEIILLAPGAFKKF
jgi:hypothetical protein